MPANTNFSSSGSVKSAPIWTNQYALVDEGSLFTASSVLASATFAAGTGIATTTSVVDDAATASATHAQNVPVAFMQNTGQAGDPNAKSIYLQFLRMIVTAAPTSATAWNFLFRLDNTARYTSGGTSIVPQNVNPAFGNNTAMRMYFGAVVTALPGLATQRVVASGMVQSTIPVVKDNWLFTFGDTSMPTNVLTASAAKNLTLPCGPVIIPPGWNCTLEMWGASNAGAPAWEFELGYAERFAGL